MPFDKASHRNQHEFQSAPDREVGRCHQPRVPFRKLGRFNPRPTVRSGDALALALVKWAELVSIRARP